MTVSPISFQGTYKVTLPNVKEAANENEKGAFMDAAINTVVMAANTSVAKPKVSADKKSMYFKIDDKNDAKFEQGFSKILEECNKKFNVDMAKKAYLQKVTQEEFDKAVDI